VNEDDITVTDAVFARLKYLATVACRKCGARDSLYGDDLCWACWRATERAEADAGIQNRAPIAKVTK